MNFYTAISKKEFRELCALSSGVVSVGNAQTAHDEASMAKSTKSKTHRSVLLIGERRKKAPESERKLVDVRSKAFGVSTKKSRRKIVKSKGDDQAIKAALKSQIARRAKKSVAGIGN
jgi:hypothetical protein